MVNLVASGRNILSEIVDYQVALPLLVVAVLGLLFIEMNHHAPLALQSTPASSLTKKLIKNTSSTSVNPISNLPTLSPVVETEDLPLGATPYTIKTAVPQSSSNGNAYGASNTSANNLQNTGKNSITSNNQPSTSDISNLINGTSSQVIKVNNSATNKSKN